MSKKIKKLSDIEAKKIAAGEVVERPVNIVKELIENSLDAGADKISIYLEDGGKKLVRVIDNGCGMSEEDALLCFEHHATSKISSVEDLEHLNSFGFRGEALSSISSVSNIELITKEEESESGIKVNLSGSKFLSKDDIATPNGTDIAVKDLFFNLPARLKFLKKTETEWRQIINLFQALCLGYDQVHFSLFHDGKQVYNIPVTENLHSRITKVFEHNLTENLIPLKCERPDIGLKAYGLISNHQLYRYNRNQIFVFVNGRWVKNPTISRSLIKGYHNVLPEGKFPIAFVFIDLPPNDIDVNVHPRKEEVSIINSRKVELALQEAVKNSLEGNLSKQLKKEVKIHSAESSLQFFKPAKYTDMDFGKGFFEETRLEASATWKHQNGQKVVLQDSSITSFEDFQKERQERVVPLEVSREYDLIGQFKKTYILLEKAEGLMYVDQHAAHERILYELFSNRFEDVTTIRLIFPVIVDLTSLEMNLIAEQMEMLQAHGIQADVFGPDKIAVQSVPVYLKNVDFTDLFKTLCSYISESKDLEKGKVNKLLTEKLRAQMACKAAVKAGDILTDEQMYNLLDELEKTNNRFSCPHGRPTSWMQAISELEKKFKRRV